MVERDSLFIRLYVDEDVHGDVGVALRQQGYDVLTAIEAKRGGLSDEAQLAYAASEARAIFSFNAADSIALHIDYLDRGEKHAGIIIAKQLSLRETIRRLSFLLNRISADEMQNQLRWLPAA